MLVVVWVRKLLENSDAGIHWSFDKRPIQQQLYLCGIQFGPMGKMYYEVSLAAIQQTYYGFL